MQTRKENKARIFAADFETTVFEGQEYTEVWSAACVELFKNSEPKVFHSIMDQFEYFRSLNENIIVYYHNLKFDGNFWLSFLLNNLKFENASVLDPNDFENFKWQKDRYMKNNTFKYVITETGQWYIMKIKVRGHIIELRDSLKLMPFALKDLAKAFNTKHKKLDMVYEGYRFAGCEITPEELEYIKNDVYVLKEALEFMYENDHKKITIGSCCMSEYKTLIDSNQFKLDFPKLIDAIDCQKFGSNTVDEYIRKSYRGGWCYVADKAHIIRDSGCTYDVNSLYPSMMHSQSGNKYPYGKPHFWTGDYIPDICRNPNVYYFIRLKCRFYLKKGMLPFIQIKGNMLYSPTENLTTSDYFDKKNKRYSRFYKDDLGNIQDTCVTLTLTQTDFDLIKKHYNLVDVKILDGCYFSARKGMFDKYIDKYAKIKQESKGAMRTLAKLFLNNLYGKFATNPIDNYKVSYVDDTGLTHFYTINSFEESKLVYIPVGSAITSYARAFTITAAQQNFYGDDKPGFKYADTDSIHCDLPADKIKGIKVHPTAFCAWKLESEWDHAKFLRQKTYVEHVVKSDGEPVEPFYDVKCAGMPKKSKDLFIKSVLCDYTNIDDFTEYEKAFIMKKRTLEDFDVGLEVPGKLLPKRILGGIILVDTLFEIRAKK